jgi:putative copper export protein
VIWELGPAFVRWAAYLGVLTAAGGAFFLAVLHDRRSSEQIPLARVVVIGGLIGGVATMLAIPLRAGRLTRETHALVDPELLSWILESSTGTSALVRLVGLTVILAAVTRLWSRAASVAALAGAAAAVGSYAIQGHSGVAEPRSLILVATLLHGVAAATWFGGLVMLTWVLRVRDLRDDPKGGSSIVTASRTPQLPRLPCSQSPAPPWRPCTGAGGARCCRRATVVCSG